MASGRCWGGVRVNDHQFLVMGQCSGRAAGYLMCEYYDNRTQKWEDLPICLPLRQIVGDRVFVTGGFWDISFSTNFGVASVDDTIYVMGGWDFTFSGRSQSDLIAIEVSNGDLSTLASSRTNWKRLAPMNYPRAFFACVSHSKFIYVFGGSAFASLERIPEIPEVYDTETNEWTTLPNMPGGARHSCAAGVVGDKIYIVGGRDENDTAMASTLVFDTCTHQWERTCSNEDNYTDDDASETSSILSAGVIVPPVPDMNTKRSRLSVVVVDEFVFAIGGRDENNDVLSSIEVLDTHSNSWTYAQASMKNGRADPVVGFCFEGYHQQVYCGGRDLQWRCNAANQCRLDKGALGYYSKTHSSSSIW